MYVISFVFANEKNKKPNISPAKFITIKSCCFSFAIFGREKKNIKLHGAKPTRNVGI